jgi:4-amino-4-deoxy-L-arabinose transferase-like glycosyltransferase
MMAYVVALVLALAGGLVPSAGWLTFLRGSAGDPTGLLLAGTALLRGLLVLLGLYLVLGARAGFWRPSGPAGEAPLRPPTRRASGLAATLVLLALGLRLYALGRGLWVDEVTTLVQYVRPPFGVIATTYDSQNQHPLYSLLAHAAFRLFGESAWALRLPAALFGTATVWALWRLGREVAGEREGLLAALVLTVSYQHVWFSQNARGYSGLLFWAVLSSWLLVRALREQRPALWAWFAVSVALGMYTHLTMLFVVLGQFAAYLWALLRGRLAGAERWRPLAAGFVLSGLLTLTLYALVLPQLRGANATDLSNVATWRSPWWMLRETLAGLGLSGPAIAAGLLVVGAGILSYLRREAIIPILLVVPVVLGGAITLATHHHLWPRFFFFAAGFGVLVVVRGLLALAERAGALLRWPDRRRLVAGTAVVLLLGLAMARSLQWVYRPKQDYAGARDFVRGALAPGDTVVVAGVAKLPYRMYYEPAWASVESLAELQAARAAARRTWLLFTLPIEMQNTHPDILAMAEREFTLVQQFDGSLNGGTIYVYRAERAAADSAAGRS